MSYTDGPFTAEYSESGLGQKRQLQMEPKAAFRSVNTPGAQGLVSGFADFKSVLVLSWFIDFAGSLAVFDHPSWLFQSVKTVVRGNMASLSKTCMC